MTALFSIRIKSDQKLEIRSKGQKFAGKYGKNSLETSLRIQIR